MKKSFLWDVAPRSVVDVYYNTGRHKNLKCRLNPSYSHMRRDDPKMAILHERSRQEVEYKIWAHVLNYERAYNFYLILWGTDLILCVILLKYFNSVTFIAFFVPNFHLPLPGDES